MKRTTLLLLLLLIFPFPLLATAPYSPDRSMKVGDTVPYYYAQVVESNGTSPHNITGDTISMSMYLVTPFYIPYNPPKISNAACVIIDAVNGKFIYQWTSANTNTAGKYYVTFTITEGSNVYTLPTNDKAYVIINALP
jgi:hypothetical protein